MSEHHTKHADHDARPLPIDPEHEVDGKKTAKWLIVSTIGFAFSWYLLVVFFDLIVGMEREKKIDHSPATDLQKQREKDQRELTLEQDLGGGTRRISIDRAIDAYVTPK